MAPWLVAALAAGCAAAAGPRISDGERHRQEHEAGLAAQLEMVLQQQRAERVAERLLRHLPRGVARDSVLDLGLRLADPGRGREERLLAEALGVPEARRPFVVAVDSTGPARGADLLPGDQILAVGDRPVEEQRDVETAVKRAPPGVPLALRVFRVGRQHAVSITPVRRARPFDLVVTDEPRTVNAFARNRTILLPTGILQVLGSDHELAVVLGHEIAHIVRGHLSGSYISGRFNPAFSRDLEREADRWGLELAHDAGYNAAAGVNLWEKLSSGVPRAFSRQWLSTHPAYTERRRQARRVTQRLRSEQILEAVLPRLPVLPPL